MKKLLLLSALISNLALADSIPTIDDFAKSKELRNQYKEQCKGIDPFNKENYPQVCINWSEGSEKAFFSKTKVDFSNIKFEKKETGNNASVTNDVVNYLKANCQMNDNEAKKAASKSFRTKTLVSTLDRFGEEKYQEKLAQAKCSHFKSLF